MFSILICLLRSVVTWIYLLYYTGNIKHFLSHFIPTSFFCTTTILNHSWLHSLIWSMRTEIFLPSVSLHWSPQQLYATMECGWTVPQGMHHCFLQGSKLSTDCVETAILIRVMRLVLQCVHICMPLLHLQQRHIWGQGCAMSSERTGRTCCIYNLQWHYIPLHILQS